MPVEPVTTIYCANYKDGDACTDGCRMLWDRDMDTAEDVLRRNPEWFGVTSWCDEHGIHVRWFCAITCFTRYHARHDHEESTP